MITKADAIRNALAKGATLAEIEAETRRQERHVGTVPFRNMITALNLMPWLNDAAAWTRLAAALTARTNKRKGKR